MAVTTTTTQRNSEREAIRASVLLSDAGLERGGHRPGQRRHGQRAARQPVHVLEEVADDLGNADGGDGQVVGSQAEADLADQIGNAAGQDTADEPGELDRQAEAADEARTAFDIGGRRVDLRAVADIGDKPGEDHQRRLGLAPDADAVGVGGGNDDGGADERGKDGAAEQRRPVRVPEVHVERVGGRHDGVAAEHDEAHDAEVELAAIAPVHVEAEGDQRVGDGADQELDGGGGCPDRWQTARMMRPRATTSRPSRRLAERVMSRPPGRCRSAGTAGRPPG